MPLNQSVSYNNLKHEIIGQVKRTTTIPTKVQSKDDAAYQV